MEVILIVGIIIGSILLCIGLLCTLIGFRPIGIAAGSCAACIQSFIGLVAKGSWFAIMNCLAMKGCFIIMIVIGLLILLGIGIYLMINSEWFQEFIEWVKEVFS